MNNKYNKATVKDGLPTADALIEENLGGLELTMDDDMWKFYKDVIRQCIESHTATHTKELGEENATLEKYNSLLIEEKESLRDRMKETEDLLDSATYNQKRLVSKYNDLSRRFKELEAENTRYRDRIGEALKFLQSRQQTTPGLGAPVTILKQALEK